MVPQVKPAGRPAGTTRRLVAVTAEGVASGAPLMVGSKLLQGWLTASGVPLALIGLIPLAELPYTLKLFWAPLLDRWPIPWPDRRRGWLLLMQLLLVAVIAAMALLRPSTDPASLTAIGVAALVLAICSATQDIAVDAYRTDLLPEAERGPGAAAAALGYRAAMLAVGAGGFLLADRYGWPAAFLAAAGLVAAVVPFTLTAPKLRPVEHAVTSLRQAVLGPAREFVRRAGPNRTWQLLLLVLFYRWPDGLLSAMAIPFLKLQGFSDADIGLVQGGWAIGATMVGTLLGGALFAWLGMNRSLWLFAIAGAAGNLSYWALARFGGGFAGLITAVSLENLSGGMVGAVFVALLMSLCNPRFSATQYALLSGVYAMSRSVLSAPAGVVAERVGWPGFFLFTVLASLPALLLLARLAPWGEAEARGAFDPERDPT
ncbi:MFS transporter [Vulcanococcus limneticus Candia 3F8]|uniref:AmpG family muropeptide MFS transporter n=1 Tax=Vulcanococcus limneticus TaxID=2170428 RepID=UPI000B993F12|nr:MFS transporter [Vulcanococcus limneticus]MCP9790240.1 MFS transporter [Vulcanococcus limneticus MW73D5]MCP9894674.1 MFS transporter [Vulcanococcus limneticus Candia 3F8]MCP9895639.1 MFS transporter [Vulcanococcus limneticus Candia 3B3]